MALVAALIIPIVILILFLTPFLFGYLLYRRRLKPLARRVVLVLLGLNLLFDAGFATLMISQIRSAPGTSLLDLSIENAKAKRDENRQKGEQSLAELEELSKYGDCLMSAKSKEEQDRCEEGLSPNVLERLKRHSRN